MCQNTIFEFYFSNHQKNKQIQTQYTEVTRTFTIMNDWAEVSITPLKHIIKV